MRASAMCIGELARILYLAEASESDPWRLRYAGAPTVALLADARARAANWPLPVRLALRELGSAARLSQADLLSLDFARITGYESGLAKLLAERFVVLHQGARQPVANGAGLSGRAAAADRNVHIEALV